jgi:hypothetical protein
MSLIKPLGFSLLVLLIVCGCSRGPSYIQIKGTVTLDGKPVADAALNFSPVKAAPGGEPSAGVTDAQGNFTLNTAHDTPGTLQGKCRVTVWKADLVPMAPGEQVPELEKGFEGQRIKYIIPKKYTQFNTSGLEFDIQPGMPPLRIELKSNP